MGTQNKADDLTAERAEYVNQLTDTIAQAFVDHRTTLGDCRSIIAAALQTARQEALREAAKAICMYCNDPEWQARDDEDNHSSPYTRTMYPCAAWKIHQLDRLASEGG